MSIFDPVTPHFGKLTEHELTGNDEQQLVIPHSIYISGPMTGKPRNNKACFDAATQRLRSDGWIVINPCYMNEIRNYATYELGLRSVIIELMKCENIYMLVDWERSRGATIEYNIAIALSMGVYWERESMFRHV